MATPKAGAIGGKSPKVPRRCKTPEPRQVHFDSEEEVPTSYLNNLGNLDTLNSRPPASVTQYTTANSPRGGFGVVNKTPIVNTASGSKNSESQPAPSTAPETQSQSQSLPQIGLAPGSQLQWHTAVNPSMSLSHQLPNTFTYNTTTAPQQQQQQQQFVLPAQHQFLSAATATATASAPLAFSTVTHQPSHITYIGLQHQPAQPRAMGDYYQNAAPPPQGVHFQPPVPDTTFGPIPHVYVPRHDGGLVPGVQVPGVQQPTAGVIQSQPVQGGYVVAQQPYYVQQPAVMGQQPVMMSAQQAFVPQPQQIASFPAVGLASGAAVPGGIPVVAGNNGLTLPEVAGVGRTAGEEQLRQVQFAHKNRLYEPQEFKPADDDPGRWYWLREVDGNWTQRDRHTLDNLDDIRWYVTDEGWFYAVKLA